MVYWELWESSLAVREDAPRGQPGASRVRDRWEVASSAHELGRAEATAAERLATLLEGSCAELLLAFRGTIQRGQRRPVFSKLYVGRSSFQGGSIH